MPALLRMRQLEQRLGVKRVTIYKRIRLGQLPPPVKYGSHVSIWPSDEIDACCAAIIRGATDDDMQQLVHDLMERRAA